MTEKNRLPEDLGELSHRMSVHLLKRTPIVKFNRPKEGRDLSIIFAALELHQGDLGYFRRTVDADR